jgi:ABC-type multidrug transport system ATPase subunit
VTERRGQTTTVRILATLSRADRGQARVAGFDVVRDRREVRRRISLTGQFAALDEAQTGDENLRMMGAGCRGCRGRRPGSGRRVAGAVRADRRRPTAGRHLLWRYAPAA